MYSVDHWATISVLHYFITSKIEPQEILKFIHVIHYNLDAEASKTEPSWKAE